MSSQWSALDITTHIHPIADTLFRVVESQAQVATSKLCDSLEETDLLESLLEAGSKPALPPGTEDLHYLLATPWRYPPLLYGSRFGSVLEPSLFYGSLSTETCLCECAYYRLLFYTDMAQQPSSLSSQHTVFRAQYQTDYGIRLHLPPFDGYAETLTHKTHYSACQALGAKLRRADVEAFEFPSARAVSGINVALITPAALAEKAPTDQSPWLCRTHSGGVTFVQTGRPRQLHSFTREQFLHDGVLPRPA